METDIGQWAVGLLRCWARLLLTSVIFSVLYWLKNKGQSTAPPTCELSATKDLYGPILASKECYHGTLGT